MEYRPLLLQVLSNKYNQCLRMMLKPLSTIQSLGLIVLSFAIVAFGEPVRIWWLGLISAIIGYALIGRVLLDVQGRARRFMLATAWFTAVMLIQLSWAISHPYAYVYIFYPMVALLLGMQFGLISLFITPNLIQRMSVVFAIAGLWTVLEWIRLFFFSGFSWNPIGLALTGGLYPMQLASLFGIYGLSFWVMLVNMLALRAWSLSYTKSAVATWIVAAMIPYAYGGIQLVVNDELLAHQQTPTFNAVLVQTNFPAETDESRATSKHELIAQALDDWRQILHVIRKQKGKAIDLMILPEYTVPCGTYTCVYPANAVQEMFQEILGPDSLKTLPPMIEPFSQQWKLVQGPVFLVNNAYIVQGIANFFKTGVVIGLEDAEEVGEGKREYYSAAMYFKPYFEEHANLLSVQRYEKRVLVPFGEYIPFSFFKTLAAAYGIQGSFTCGEEAKVFLAGNNIPFGISICYEETFGDIMRENKQLGAELLVNLTSDAWYPNSLLPMQHFLHARLRTVENGIPLIRATNIGITGGYNSLGQIVGYLGQESDQPEWLLDSLHISIPTYTYPTLYSHVGDNLVLGMSIFVILFALGDRKRL